MNNIDISPVAGIDGQLEVSGAKNSVLLLLASTVLAEGVVVLNRVPRIADVDKMCELLNVLNIKTSFTSSDSLLVDPTNIQYADLTGYQCGDIRTSVLFLGAMLGRFGRVKLRMPGGCNLGKRPIDLHIRAMEMMGATVRVNDGILEAKTFMRGDSVVEFTKPTVTGTANAILAAARRQGETHIESAVLEPEIDDLLALLKRMGVEARRMGTQIVVEGGVQPGEAAHTVMPDRIEAGTFLIATAIMGGELTLQQIDPNLLTEPLRCLRKVGAEIIETADTITIKMHQRPKAMDVMTGPYPAFPTDLQQQWSVLAAISEGSSCIHDPIFPERTDHFEELNKMGAKCRLIPGGSIVNGVPFLTGATITARSLRSAAAMALAALSARGKSRILQINYLNRGYVKFFDKIKNIEKTVA